MDGRQCLHRGELGDRTAVGAHVCVLGCVYQLGCILHGGPVPIAFMRSPHLCLIPDCALRLDTTISRNRGGPDATHAQTTPTVLEERTGLDPNTAGKSQVQCLVNLSSTLVFIVHHKPIDIFVHLPTVHTIHTRYAEVQAPFKMFNCNPNLFVSPENRVLT